VKGTYTNAQKGLYAYCKHFSAKFDEALLDYVYVLRRDHELHAAGTLDTNERGDVIITCELCRDDAWWQENYGSLWQAAQWWHCGPFGLDCP